MYVFYRKGEAFFFFPIVKNNKYFHKLVTTMLSCNFATQCLSHASVRLITRSFSIDLNESGFKSLSRLGELNRGFIYYGITV